jgi:hypothetical protein
MKDCAAVVMAKQPAPGRTKTRLCPPLSFSAAARLYEALLNDTIALVSSVPSVALALAVTPAEGLRGAWRPPLPPGTPVLTVEGPDIGACLDRVTRALIEHGCSRVIALNSDGPTLPAGYLEQAQALLGRHDVVLGPSDDGGYYLVGVHRPQPGLFRDIAWSTDRVMAQTLERAASLGLSVGLLPGWYDVDTAADLDRFRVELASLPADAARCTRRFLAAAGLSDPRGRPREGMPR